MSQAQSHHRHELIAELRAWAAYLDAHAQHFRLITAIRTVAELLDNCADGLVSNAFAATALLLAIIALHALANALENCPDVLTLYFPPCERS